MTNITSRYRKKSIVLYILSWLLCFGLATTFIAIALGKYTNPDPNTLIELEKKVGSVAYEYIDKLKTIAITGLISLLPMMILSIVVKDKIRPTLWMLNIILSNLLINGYMMYVVFGCWVLDNYIITPLAKSYHNKYVINKEIDKRG